MTCADALRRLYDPALHLTLPECRLRSTLLDQAGITTGHTVLDVGSGTGSLLMLLSERVLGATLIGVEPDAGMMHLALKKNRHSPAMIRWTSGSALSLPFKSEAFDRVLITFVLHHLNTANKELALAEIFRVLRPTGRLHVADWGKAHTTLMRIAGLSLKIFEPREGLEANLHGRLPELCRRAGFHSVTQTSTMSTIFGTVTLMRATRPAADRP